MKLHLFGFILFIFTAIFSGVTQLHAQSSKYKGEQDFRISIGALPMSDHLMDGFNDNQYEPYLPTMSDNFEAGLMYRGNTTSTGSISLSYSYRLNKWFSFGAEGTYTGTSCNYYDRFTDQKLYSHKQNLIAISPMCRFTFLSKKYVQLYSQVSMGVGILMEKSQTSSTQATLSAHLSYFGVRVGKSVYGFGELGFGNRGLIMIGAGYCINSNR